jgi:hypothetical protein
MSTVRRAVVIGRTPMVAAADLIGLEAPAQPAAPAIAAPVVVNGVVVNFRPPPGSPEERESLLSTLATTNENIALTARALGVSRVTMYRMLRRHAIVPSRGFNAPPGASVPEEDLVPPQEHAAASRAE